MTTIQTYSKALNTNLKSQASPKSEMRTCPAIGNINFPTKSTLPMKLWDSGFRNTKKSGAQVCKYLGFWLVLTVLVEQYVGRLQVPVHYMSPGQMLSYKVVSLGDDNDCDDDRDDDDDDGDDDDIYIMMHVCHEK